jgi:hypothetical protein
MVSVKITQIKATSDLYQDHRLVLNLGQLSFMREKDSWTVQNWTNYSVNGEDPLLAKGFVPILQIADTSLSVASNKIKIKS